MPRLRTTTVSSLLVLLIGITGTQWLCTLTDDWTGARARDRLVAASPPHRAVPRRRAHGVPRVVGAIDESRGTDGPTAAPGPPTLVALSTPPDPTPTWMAAWCWTSPPTVAAG
jgi:hypothetical protein